MSIKKEYVEKNGQTYKITLDYEKGGINYLSGATNRRGYYVYCQPVILCQENGYTTESFMMFDGMKKNLVICERKSKKIEGQLVAKFAKHRDEILELYLQRKLEKATI